MNGSWSRSSTDLYKKVTVGGGLFLVNESNLNNMLEEDKDQQENSFHKLETQKIA